MFAVPGWSVPSAPVKEQPKATKKRKHSSTQDHGHVPGVERLLENLLPKVEPASSRRHKKRKGEPGSVDATGLYPAPRKRKRNKKQISNQDSSKMNASDISPSLLTDLQRNMKESLDGARFRLINETFYKSDSHEAKIMMQKDPKIFEEYHTGFRHQVLSWPTNPVDLYISKFSTYPTKPVIADLGCGDAALAKYLLPKGISVISFDLVSENKFVVEADICERIPLPGSEGCSSGKSAGEGQVVDVVVCALSLMGTNWVKCLRETWRILKAGGQLHIAEVSSRFTDVEQFITLVGSIGFHLKSRDDSNTHFMLFEFAKVVRPAKSDKEWAKLVAKGTVLKPCEYKRR